MSGQGNGEKARQALSSGIRPPVLAHLASILYLAGYVALRLWLHDTLGNPGQSGEGGVVLILYTLPLSLGLVHLLPGETGIILALLLNTAVLWLTIYLGAKIIMAMLRLRPRDDSGP